MLSRNKIKYLTSLKIKKFRVIHNQFIVEGDKIVKDTLRNKKDFILQIIASGAWLNENHKLLDGLNIEVNEADTDDLARISSLETPPQAIAVLEIPNNKVDPDEISVSLSIGLDNIQDPGNLGTIIRTADWFGIQNIFCSAGCADVYNPKVIQSSMGALINIKIHYLNLRDLLMQHAGHADWESYGTFLDGTPVFSCEILKQGIIIFGNESRGISPDLRPFIKNRITIPPGLTDRIHVESLNVSSAVAIVCAQLTR